jgi:predicted RNA polymerase sigma factor
VSQIRADSGGRASYEKALALARQEPERRFLARRLAEIEIKPEKLK